MAKKNGNANPALKIEDGIPLPTDGRGRVASPAGTAVRQLEVGQSVLIPNGSVKHPQTLAGNIGQKLQRKFVTRTVDGGVRVWRVS